MIYNWTNFVGQIHFVEVDHKSYKAELGDTVKSAATYVTAKVTHEHLLDPDGRYQAPAASDVMILGDDTYALDAVLTSKKRGSSWEFTLLLHKMVKEVFAPPKTFARSAN